MEESIARTRGEIESLDQVGSKGESQVPLELNNSKPSLLGLFGALGKAHLDHANTNLKEREREGGGGGR